MSIPTIDDVLWDYADRRARKEQFCKELNVVVEPDGTVTMTGLNYRDFDSLMTSASLYRYDQDEQPSLSQKDLVEALAKQARGEPLDWSGQIEILRRNAHEDRCWRNGQRSLVDAIDDLLKAALAKHNKAYSRWEGLYFRVIGLAFWPRMWVWKRKRAITQFFKRQWGNR